MASYNIKVSGISGAENEVNVEKINVTGVKYVNQIVPSPPAQLLPHMWSVPHRNGNFVGRSELIEQIELHYSQNDSPFILTACHGLGGVGKTQVALEFVWQHYEHYNGVVWFNAESRDQLQNEYISLGRELNIIGDNEKKDASELVRKVKHWLENPSRAGWLLVYDNAQNYEYIRELLPVKKGNLLVTSRYSVGWPQESIPVDVFTEEESRAYIKKVLGSQLFQSDTTQIVTLAQVLGRLPLALAQACAYISMNKISLSRYLQLYEKRKQEMLSKKKSLLSDQLLSKSHEGSQFTSVYITWDITMEQISEESSLAANLLNACACLASNDIPDFLLEEFANAPENNPTDEIFEEALGTLNSFSMLTINPQTLGASIHRLVQEVTRLKFEDEQTSKYFFALVNLFKVSFPFRRETVQDYAKKIRLLPHLEAFLQHLEEWKKQQPQVDTKLLKELEGSSSDCMLFLMDGYFFLRNDQKSQKWLEQAFKITKIHYGPDHPSTLTTQVGIAAVLYKQGKYEKALKAYNEVYEKRKDVLGPHHPDTLTTRHNVAFLLNNLGRYEEALKVYEEVYEIQKRQDVLGPHHPDTLITRHNIAFLLNDQGKYEYSLKIHNEVYEINKREDILGPDHPNTVTDQHCIAGVLNKQGKYEEALKIYEEVYEKRKEILGPHHPDTLTTQNNYALVLDNQGKYEEAIKIYNEVHEKRRDILGPDHPDTLTTRHDISFLLNKQGKYEEALKIYEEVYEKRKDILGPHHPDTLTTRNNYALVLDNQGNYEEALKIYKEVHEKRRDILGPDHPDTLTTRNSIANVLKNQRKYEEALKEYREVYEKRKAILGEHPDTLATRNMLDLVRKFETL